MDIYYHFPYVLHFTSWDISVYVKIIYKLSGKFHEIKVGYVINNIK
jgi:hypothetical protein